MQIEHGNQAPGILWYVKHLVLLGFVALLPFGGCGQKLPAEKAAQERLTVVDGGVSDAQVLDSSSTDTTPIEAISEHSSQDAGHSHQGRNCDPVDCVLPPASTCLSKTKLRAYDPKGSCHPVDDKCVYTRTDKDCAGVCHQGQCFAKDDPCLKLTCDKPPAATCFDANTLRTFASRGTCRDKKCTYAPTDQACTYGCDAGKCKAPPPPPDPCAGVTCNKPPAAKCTSATKLRTYYKTGRCKSGSCAYSFADQSCPHGCASGKCKVGDGFSAVNPFRAFDTRSSSMLNNDSSRCFQITGKGNVPGTARAVYINLTSVNATGPGFLTAYPKGSKVPNASTLNYTTDVAIANGSIIKVGQGGQICVFAKIKTHIIVDVYGYFDADSDYFPVGPHRRLDTRDANKTRAAASTVCYPIAGRNGVPSNAKAAFVNIAIVRPKAPGFVSVYPKGIKAPTTSNLNYAANEVIASGSIVALGTGGEICVYVHAEAHLILDVYGFFGKNSSYVPVGPKRIFDTRNGAKPAANTTRCYDVAGAHGLPKKVKAIAFNVAVIAPEQRGFLQVFTEGNGRPATSTINFLANQVRANNALVQPGSSGKVCVHQIVSAHYVLDLSGYWQANHTGDPCAGITCRNPPAPICTGTQVIASYDSNGTCNNGTCVYTLKTKTCAYKCDKAKCIPKPPDPPPPPPAFTFHPVTSWQTPQDPVRSGSYMDIKALRFITIHYNGGNLDLDGPDNVYQDSDFAKILQRSQRDYTVNRGYSLGYNSGVAPDGDEWEIRGLRYRAASNGCSKVNRPAYTIFVPVRSVGSPPTAAQVKGINAVIARIRAAAKAAGNPHHLTINGHRDVRPQCGSGGTACPGVHLYQMIQNGTIGPK